MQSGKMLIAYGVIAFMFNASAKTLTWVGGDETWDKATANWKNELGDTDVYADGDNVVFDSSATVTIAENVAPATITITNATVTLNCADIVTSLTGATTVAHDGDLTLKGAGLTTLGSFQTKSQKENVDGKEIDWRGKLTIDADAVMSCGKITSRNPELTLSCAVAQVAEEINIDRYLKATLTLTVGDGKVTELTSVPKVTFPDGIDPVNKVCVILKSGLGTIKTSIRQIGYIKATEMKVLEGTLQFDGKIGASAKSYHGPFTVARGATLDVNDTQTVTCGVILEDGAKLINTGSSGLSRTGVQFSSITLTGDAIVETPKNFGLVGSGYAATELNLNGHTLTKKGASDLILINTTITTGTIDLQEGALQVTSRANTYKTTIPATDVVTICQSNTEFLSAKIYEDSFSDTSVKHDKIAINGTLVKTGAGPLKIESDIACAAETGALDVREGSLIVTGEATYAGKLSVAEGATLVDDVTLPSGATLSGKGTIKGATAFADGAILDATQGTLTFDGAVSAVEAGLPTVKLNVRPSTQPKLFNLTEDATFTPFPVNVMVGEKSYGEWKLAKKADGIYLRGKGFMLVVK